MDGVSGASVELSTEQSGFIEYKNWELQATNNAINSFLSDDNNLDYNEEYLDLIMAKHTKVYAELSEFILKLASDNGIKNINVRDYTYFYASGVLYFSS